MANVSVTFPLVFDLDTNTTMAGEDIGAVDAECVINVDVMRNMFMLKFVQGSNDTDQFNVNFIAPGVSETFNPFDDMLVATNDGANNGGLGTSSDLWSYEPNQQVVTTSGSEEPGSKIETTWTNNISAYPSKTVYTNVQSIIMQLIADHYFNHPLATAPIENDDAIAHTVNKVLKSMKAAWDLSGSTQTADDSTPASILNRNTLLAKRAILEQFINDAANTTTGVTGTTPERFTRLVVDDETSVDGVTTFEFINNDTIEFLLYFTNTVDHTVSTSELLNNTVDESTSKFVDESGVATSGLFSGFSKKIKLVFTMKDAITYGY